MIKESGSRPRLVVGVGASAGGLEAFKELLGAVPSDSGMTFILVQHLSPRHKSLLAEVLSSATDMTVREAEQDLELRPDTVYIIPPDKDLAIRGDRIELSRQELHGGIRLPVDHLFHSLAEEYGSRAVAVVLSGAGSDGSAGIRAVRAAGGLVIAQDPESTGQSGMPKSAIASGMVDLVLSLEEIPSALERFDSLQEHDGSGPPPERGDGGERKRAGRLGSLTRADMGRLAGALAHLGFDLRRYKSATVQRRVLRRMALAGFEETEPYIELVVSSPDEQQRLMRDLLIRVTQFFRDPDAFEALRELAIDPLVAGSETGDTLRVWIPGCATGEEVYSLGIEILDAMANQEKELGLQIFATDIDRDALAVGRLGIYPPSIADQVPEAYLRKYFEAREGRGYEVCSRLRDVVSFAVHDVTRDPPFSQMDLVSCRNLLIYLTTEAQKEVLNLLHFALTPKGHLFLSTSESTGPQREMFTTVSKAHRIFQKRGSSRPISVAPSRARIRGIDVPSPPRRVLPSDRGQLSGTDLARRAVLDAIAPPTLVVSNAGEILFSHGELSPYVRIPEGEHPRFEIGSMLRPEIATRVRGALYKCRRSGEPVVVVSSPDVEGQRVRVRARPAPALGQETVVLTFEEIGEEDLPDAAADQESPAEEAVIDELERELQATREDLRNTVEELELSNEELRSSNEEAMSMNEELQSANEELEATSEELRSLNEELTTVNAQLREKVDQVEEAHDDLTNFFASTRIATVFLDQRLRIKRFTPVARKVLGIDDADTGRFVGAIARELLQSDLLEEAKRVLDDLAPQAKEIRTREGRWFSREVLPYRTGTRRIEGVVVTFLDVTELKNATERLAFRGRQQSAVARLGLLALRQADFQKFTEEVVREVQETLEVDFTKILELQPERRNLLLRAGIGWKEGRVGSATEEAGSGSPAGYALRSREPVVTEDMSSEKRFSVPALFEEHGITSGMSCVVGDADYRYGVIGAYTTERRTFSTEDVDFLQAVANVVGSAIGRYQARRQLAIELGVAHVLAEAEEVDEALEGILQSITTEFGPLAAAELWVPTQDGLVRRAIHVRPPSRQRTVARDLERERFDFGEGLIGQTFHEGRALWVTDLSDSAAFLRHEAAEDLGLVSGFAIPISAGGRQLGVISVFSSQRLFADDNYLHSLETVGRSIGDFLARTEAAEAARELAAITASSHDAILAYRPDGTIVRWLQGAEELFGYSAEEMVGASIDVIVPEELRDERRDASGRMGVEDLPAPYETVRVRKDGTRVEVSVRVSPVVEDDGRIVAISSTERDISHMKETERRLVEAHRQKDEFIAMLGHELRNPLGVIRTAAELLRLGDGRPGAVERSQAIIERQSEHMSRLLDGLLDISRIISGKIHLEKEVVDLVEVSREVWDDLASQGAGRERQVEADWPEEPIPVEGDRVRLTQIVSNLVANAIKYTEAGGSVSARLSREGADAVLRVKDTGIGIEPDLLPHIFEAFRQSRQSLDRSEGGLGLGLALVKSLVDLHGGSVEARSDGPGQGAEFVVRLPLTTGRGIERRSLPDLGEPYRILIIEDNLDAGEMLKDVLEAAGHQVMVATRGVDGIELAREHHPDVVLCDLGLPDGVTGFDVAERMRSDPTTRSIPLVALSGYGRPEDKKRASDAGFDTHLTKPVSLGDVVRALGRMRTGELA